MTEFELYKEQIQPKLLILKWWQKLFPLNLYFRYKYYKHEYDRIMTVHLAWVYANALHSALTMPKLDVEPMPGPTGLVYYKDVVKEMAKEIE